MKNIKILTLITIVVLGVLFVNVQEVLGNTNTTYVNLSDKEIKVNNETITTDTNQNIYLSNIMDNGGSSNEAIEANEEIDSIININNSGTYEFTGELSNGQISVNSNNINGDVIIVLNNATITCKKAPAIFVYNTDTKSTNCNVTIKTANNSTNIISGGKLKQSVEGWADQKEIIYYVDKGYNDEREYYERYKYDGAISSDISLTFEGEGTLTVNSLKKEGIESKRDITINSGNYIINSLDDGINACADRESVITINDGTILVNVLPEAEEGDGIDSNGSIYINGGSVYAFASETSQDSGLDSDLGIYINGGVVVGTGNMADEVSSNSKQNFIQLQFRNKVEANTLIAITKNDKTPITAFTTEKTYTVLTISYPGLTNEEYMVYEGGNIQGNNVNGLYTEITSYTEGVEKEYNTTAKEKMMGGMQKNPIENIYIFYWVLAILIIALIILIIVCFILKKKGKFTMKGKALVLCIGILIGAILTTTIFFVYNEFIMINPNARGERQIQNNGAEFDGEIMQKPDGEIPEKPEDIEQNTKGDEIFEKLNPQRKEKTEDEKIS